MILQNFAFIKKKIYFNLYKDNYICDLFRFIYDTIDFWLKN